MRAAAAAALSVDTDTVQSGSSSACLREVLPAVQLEKPQAVK